MIRILTIEDDPQTASEIQAELSAHGYLVDVAHDGHTGMSLAQQGVHEGVTLDRMLPDMDGLEWVGRLRRMGLNMPVLMISALGDVDERIKGLRAGGDDYLTKPFDLEELVARMEVLMRRRASGHPSTHLRLGDLELDLLKREAKRGTQALSLRAKEFQLLEFLLRNHGQVLTKRMLLEAVWNLHFDPSTNVIEVHIARLRKLVDLPGCATLIHTVRGSGYVMDLRE